MWNVRGCIHKFPDWPPGARTALGVAILWACLVSFAAITLCVASQRVFNVVVYFVMTQSGNFRIHPRTFSVTGNVDQLTDFVCSWLKLPLSSFILETETCAEVNHVLIRFLSDLLSWLIPFSETYFPLLLWHFLCLMSLYHCSIFPWIWAELSYFVTDSQSVSQSVMALSPLCDSWPYFSCS
jgi:hypothetical protein